MPKELKLYLKTLIFGEIVFILFYLYLHWSGEVQPINSAVADTSIFLMGLSMILSSVCYFWNFLDSTSIYKKYLGLIGFAFAAAHLLLSTRALFRLFSIETWEAGRMWAPLWGFIAFVIFSVMAAISNTTAAKLLGGRLWKTILRTGYLGIIFVSFHVLALRVDDWLLWVQEGFKTFPPLNLLLTFFMIAVMGMRIALWIALQRRQPVATAPQVKPSAAPATPTPVPAASPQAPVQNKNM